jgi:flagellin-like protein
MRRGYFDRDGVSEIVGALMLTLIVVVAAASFSVFVNQRQQEYQEQQLLEQRRSLESLQVLSLRPTEDVGGLEWAELNFTISSFHGETSRITRMVVNDFTVKEFEIHRFNRTSGAYDITTMDYHDKLEITTLETVQIIVNVSTGFFETSAAILTSDSIALELSTAHLNTFSRVFIPPTAIARVLTEAQWDSSIPDYVPFQILDASASVLYGDAYAVTFAWSLLGDNDGDGTYGESGEDVLARSGTKVAAGFATSGITYQITLVVEDNNGMSGFHTFLFDY